MIFLSILSGILGCFLLVWAVHLRRLSVAQRPRFSRQTWFRWGVPLLGIFLGLVGFGLAVRWSLLWGSISLILSAVLCWLLLQYDQYSAMIRILYGHYFDLKTGSPQAKEFDLLYSIVKSHRPRWREERVTEVCVGKDIKQLVLLLLVLEFEIHPLEDMRLYEGLKARVEGLYPKGLKKS
jgi:hypothetical protein